MKLNEKQLSALKKAVASLERKRTGEINLKRSDIKNEILELAVLITELTGSVEWRNS